MIKTKENSEHYFWGEQCDSWVFHNNDNLVVKQEMMPPKTSEKLHFHKLAQQFFYILKGIATFELNGKTIIVQENQGLHIKPNEKHRIFNKSNFDLEFIVISEPKSHGDRINL